MLYALVFWSWTYLLLPYESYVMCCVLVSHKVAFGCFLSGPLCKFRELKSHPEHQSFSPRPMMTHINALQQHCLEELCKRQLQNQNNHCDSLSLSLSYVVLTLVLWKVLHTLWSEGSDCWRNKRTGQKLRLLALRVPISYIWLSWSLFEASKALFTAWRKLLRIHLNLGRLQRKLSVSLTGGIGSIMVGPHYLIEVLLSPKKKKKKLC